MDECMNSVLIIGSGGREHALLKAFLRSDRPLCMFAFPGNPGMERDGCMLVDRPINSWQDLADWEKRDFLDKHYLYFWADGICCNVRMDDRQCRC